MACTDCQRRAALIAALAPKINSLSLSVRRHGYHGLLGVLALSNEQLLDAAKVKNPREFLRAVMPPRPSEHVPTALCRHDPGYPAALAQLPSAPAVLYASCTTERLRELLSKPTVAIAGGHKYSGHTRQPTFTLARDLACAGVTVISGLDKGLEGIAQHGVLSARGSAIAVTVCAVERPYARCHQDLHERVVAHGAVLSEFPPGFFLPQSWSFPASQRIIAALASIIVIAEAKSSHALFTAEIAAELGQDIAVVPGRVTDPGGHWIYRLLRDGAQPIACAQDVINLIYGAGAREKAA
jgi:DNA processing protein